MNTTDVERISRFRKAVTPGQSTGDTAARNKRRLPEFAGQCPEEEENRSIVRLKSCLAGGFLFNQSLPGENNSQTHIQSRKAVEIGSLLWQREHSVDRHKSCSQISEELRTRKSRVSSQCLRGKAKTNRENYWRQIFRQLEICNDYNCLNTDSLHDGVKSFLSTVVIKADDHLFLLSERISTRKIL